MKRIVLAAWLMACATSASGQQSGRYQFFSVNDARSYVLDTQTGRTWLIALGGCTDELKRSLPPQQQCGFEALQAVPYSTYGGMDEAGKAKSAYFELPPPALR